jgi:hypothetical protein
MYPSKDARELAVLLRISRELDIVGDISATVDSPSELLAWANILVEPEIVAWRAKDSGHRFLHATAEHKKAPVRGRITAVLPGDPHADFWHELGLDRLDPGEVERVTLSALDAAWSAMPITTADLRIADPSTLDSPDTGPSTS